jgi:hypothetical protein
MDERGGEMLQDADMMSMNPIIKILVAQSLLTSDTFPVDGEKIVISLQVQ